MTSGRTGKEPVSLPAEGKTMSNRTNELAQMVLCGLMSVVAGCGDQSPPGAASDLDSQEAASEVSQSIQKPCTICGPSVQTLVSGSQPITGLAANGQYVFWTAKPDANLNVSHPVVFKVPVAGGVPTTIFSPPDIPENTSSIVLDQV